MSYSQDALSSLRWREPAEGLEFGEVFLGGIASSYIGRGRSVGYAVYFTDRRVIGFRKRFLVRILLVPYAVVIGSLFILSLLEIGSAIPIFASLPFVIIAADYGLRIPSRKLSERIIAKHSNDITRALKGKKDFELRRNEIGEFLMQKPGKDLFLASKGYLRITVKTMPTQPVEIKIHGRKQSQKLRELVISFSAIDPKVTALEYP